MKTHLPVAAGVASFCLAFAAFGADMAQPSPTLDVKQLPAPVQATLEREGFRVTKVQEQTDNGTRFYDATVSKGGKNYSVYIANDGTVLNREPFGR
ncbi:MAG: hypothetical protein JO090_14805 [Rhizobacter sp.]|nr:hypothetical protein [Rhizobacter sp.]